MTTEIPPPPTPAAPVPVDRQSAGIAPRTALVLLVAVVVAAGGCLLALALTPSSAHAAVVWTGVLVGVVFCGATTLLAHARFTGESLRRMLSAARADNLALQSEIAARQAADRTLADRVVPLVVEKLRSGNSAETALAAAPPTENEAHRKVLEALATEVHRGEARRASAIAAAANAAGRMQALATGMAADLREMEHRHTEEEVLGDLLHLDHRTAQAGRLADCIAVLTGARSGRRWAKPIVMESILRGAMGRIGGYQRVRLHSSSGVAIAGHAAEGVMHVLAELMDNAANFSPPTSEVHVYVEEVAAGAVVTVEDGGLIMGEVALRRAEQAVQGGAEDLAGISGTRLGLAVVGRLARKHGLSVAFRPSAHGGTGVLVRIPRGLLTEPPAEAAASSDGGTLGRGTTLASATASGRDADRAAAPSAHPHEHAPDEVGPSGLPKRRRGRTLADTQAPQRPDTQEGSDSLARTAEESGSRLGAFRRAVQRAEAERPGDGRADEVPAPTSGPLPEEQPLVGGRASGTASSEAPEEAPSATAPIHASPRPEEDTR